MSSDKNIKYQLPPKQILDLVDAPVTPGLSLSPDMKWLLFMKRPSMPGIEELAQKELRLAGLRINPKNNGPSRGSHYLNIQIRGLTSDKLVQINGLPGDAKIRNIGWSRDSKRFAFTNTKVDGLELWIVDLESTTATKVTENIINNTIGGLPFRWMSDSKNLMYKSILPNRGHAPIENELTAGPIVQENAGDRAPVRTYQDLLKNEFDESLFTYYASSQLVQYNLESKTHTNFGKPGIIKSLTTSPDANYILVATVKQPFSYLVQYDRFPFSLDIFDKNGNHLQQFADIPLAENIPKGFGAVREGKRDIAWRGDRPASLYWVEAQDGGDPNVEAEIRDQLFYLEAPFDKAPTKSISFKLRFGGLDWCNDGFATCMEWWWQNRRMLTCKWDPSKDSDTKEVLFDRSWEDVYADPGSFEETLNEYGRSVLMLKDGKTLFLTGSGASPEGKKPFVDEFDLETKATKRIWQSEAPYYEIPIAIIDEKIPTILTRRESEKDNPNFYLRNTAAATIQPITTFENPYKSLEGVQKELVQYFRADGIELTGTLYLPEGYKKEHGRLPTIMWAYPKEFKSKDAAGQLDNSPYEFLRVGWHSPLYWVTQGYAVFDDVGMPIVGEGKEEPNETFIQQLTSGAEAAVKKVDEMGIADLNRIAVGGHSYGAFMTANLLAHTDLFAAGIARSGAYNRTLTPFGFQSEERTLWEAPETYVTMSPFMHADKIKDPLLLIHGNADNNSGTYPMQTERFFNALNGHGATVRMVLLPHESHSYQARESIMHMLWEMDTWLAVHVKEKKVEMV